MGRYDTMKLTKPGIDEKENYAPKTKKQSVSISKMFAKQDHRLQPPKDDARDVLGPRPAGISKPRTHDPRFFARFSVSKKPAAESLYRDFADAASEYRHGAAKTSVQQLEPVYDALVARVDGNDIEGRPLETTEVARKREVETLVSETTAHLRSLDEDQITIQTTRKDGSIKTLDVKLGDTFDKFEKLLNQKRAELESISGRYKKLEADIAATRSGIQETEKVHVRKANDNCRLQLKQLMQRVKANKDKTASEIEQARKEEDASRATNERLLEKMFDQML